MIELAASALFLFAGVACVVGGGRFGAKHIERTHHAQRAKTGAILAQAKRTDYQTRTLHKDATDALLEVRQLAERVEREAIGAATLLQKAEQIMNDPRVRHALLQSNG